MMTSEDSDVGPTGLADEDEDQDTALLFARLRESREAAEQFGGWMEQQLADADAVNQERHRDQDEADAAMWGLVEDLRAMRPHDE